MFKLHFTKFLLIYLCIIFLILKIPDLIFSSIYIFIYKHYYFRLCWCINIIKWLSLKLQKLHLKTELKESYWQKSKKLTKEFHILKRSSRPKERLKFKAEKLKYRWKEDKINKLNNKTLSSSLHNKISKHLPTYKKSTFLIFWVLMKEIWQSKFGKKNCNKN